MTSEQNNTKNNEPKILCEHLSKIQQELAAPKKQFNAFGNYKYRSCEDILEAVKPLLGKAILTIDDDIVQIGERYYVKATAKLVYNGETKTATAFAREIASQKGMYVAQITGATSSYARKYALNGLFCIDDARNSDITEPDDTPLPPKPTDQELKTLDIICEILQQKTGKAILKDKVAALFLANFGRYPSRPDKAAQAVKSLIEVVEESEWTTQGNMTKIMETIEQAFFNFATEQQDYLADKDGKVEFTQDMFIKAVTKVFGALPINKSANEIAKSVKPEDVATRIKEK